MKSKGRDVYMVAGGVTKFSKASPDMDFRLRVKKAFDYAMNDAGLTLADIDGSVASYFSDHFQRQLMAGIMVQDYLGLVPKPSKRIEGGGATGGLAFQAGYEEIASGRMDAVVVYGFETMSHVNTWKGNEFIALASDTNFDYPIGGFYTGYYAMMAVRHMHEFGTTVEQMAKVSVKNHGNAIHNPYAQSPMKITVEDVRKAPMVSYPLTRLDVCAMSDGAAVAILASEDKAFEITDHPVLVKAIGTGTDTMRLSDRPFGEVPLLPNESPSDYKGLKYPGVHSFRAGRMAAKEAYEKAEITDPINDLDLIELHDAYTSSEIQTYEDLGLCKYGEGGQFIDEGKPELKGKIPVNPSGGLLAAGHPVGATGIMQAVFMFWQLQHTIKKHFHDDYLQVPNAKRGLIHSHAGTGTYVTVTIMEAVK
ncbi:nonspecific lipid-transfer protein [Thermoplasma volcanium GSS1]|uniref:propanoyl-CoA C-acyltransferase n=1 Tax=Thermoplasma volcanium (strain ATCC 51530 / DSM 4299 / JCM 9571 / NBRC 15438 / GSS1) TaxID=273116 RepID=Q978Y1_THEVO|nr:thiolase domain-containing protein [Thermoplasma volcanium]BAB60425.1 nonspecific lipid-transfer protein [Thermoplasma volcanium GSS1]